jgi:hypothetical protein
MSTFRVARDTANADEEALERSRGDGDYDVQIVPDSSAGSPDVPAIETWQGALDKLTKWIPGDTLAIYAPGVTLLSVTTDRPSLLFLVIMIIVTPLFVLGVAFSTSGVLSRRSLAAAGLAATVFTIWSMSVPFSGWQSIAGVADHKGAVAIGAAVAGILFGYVAEGITKHLAS